MQTYHRDMARRHFPTRLCMVRGVRPFLSKKYDITRHPNYKYLSDFDKSNVFDIEKHLKQLRRPRPPFTAKESFTLYDTKPSSGYIAETPDTDIIGEIES